VDDLYPYLQAALLSHEQALRLAVLRLLSLPISQGGTRADTARRCLQAEEVSLDVHGVRERLLRVGRLVQTVRDDDEVEAEMCSRWLTG
jgi:U3 small nucleolar RNA-associated protein 20